MSFAEIKSMFCGNYNNCWLYGNYHNCSVVRFPNMNKKYFQTVNTLSYRWNCLYKLPSQVHIVPDWRSHRKDVTVSDLFFMQSTNHQPGHTQSLRHISVSQSNIYGPLPFPPRSHLKLTFYNHFLSLTLSAQTCIFTFLSQ